MPAHNRKQVDPGDRFNNWTVVQEAEPRLWTQKDGKVIATRKFDVVCDCGRTATKSMSDMRKYSACQGCLKVNYPAGSKINDRVVLEEIQSPRQGRYFLARCVCGSVKETRLDALLNYKACSTNCHKVSQLGLDVSSVPFRSLARTQPWVHWTNILREVCGEVCDDWKDFMVFLKWYLEATGKTAEQVVTPKVTPNVITLVRINKDLPWSPDNTQVRHFFTERARHLPSYKYWNELKKQEILSEEVLSYKDFVAAFGIKQPHCFLTRRDLTKPHSKTNSFWKEKNVRRQRISREEHSVEP